MQTPFFNGLNCIAVTAVSQPWISLDAVLYVTHSYLIQTFLKAVCEPKHYVTQYDLFDFGFSMKNEFIHYGLVSDANQIQY